MRRLQERMGRLRCGHGLDGAVDMGARGAAARDLAQRYVSEAQSQGAQVSWGTDSGVPEEEGPESSLLGLGEVGPGAWTPGSEGRGAGGLSPGSLGRKNQKGLAGLFLFLPGLPGWQ